MDPRLNLPSASSFAIDVECPGRRNLIRESGEELTALAASPDPDADRGTRIHRALETGSTLDLQDDEEVEAYQASKKFEEFLFIEWRRNMSILPTVNIGFQQETRLWLHHPERLAPLMSGQLDIHWVHERYALIIDRKTGWNPNLPPSNRSHQLRVQAVLLKQEYPQLEIIRVAHCKPKFRAEPTDWTDYTESDLETSLRSVLLHLWETQQPDAPLKAGRHCGFCAAKSFCVAAASYSLLPSVIAFRAAPDNGMIQQAVDKLLPEDCVMLWDRSSVIIKILDEVKKRLKGMPPEELDRLGLEFGKGRALNPIVDVRGAFDRVAKELPTEKIWDVMSIGKTELAKTLQRELGWSADAAKGWIVGQLAGFIQEKVSEAPLVRK